MGCGISAAVNGLDWYIVSLDQKGAENRVKVGVKVENETFDVEFNNEAKKSGGRCVYNIKSGDATYKLVLLYDGGILIDGQFPQSVIYKQGKTELKFYMRLEAKHSTGLMSGTIDLTDQTSLTGSFDFLDTTTSNIVGVKDESEDTESYVADGGEGKQSVIIDESTYKKVKEIEKKLEKYQGQDLYSSLNELTNKAEELEVRIKHQVEDIQHHKIRLDEERKENGPDSKKCKALEIELESKCLALAADQEQYDVTLQYIRTRTADLFDYNMLTEQFDDLLNAMFRGQSGSDIENQFEAMLDEAEDAEAQYAASFHIEEKIWQNAKGLSDRLLQALNRWSSLENTGYYCDHQREFLAKQTRVLVVQTIDELAALENILTQYPTYDAEKGCMHRLSEFKDNIFTLYQSTEGVKEGIETIMFCQVCTRRIEQWVYDKFKIKEGQEKLKALQKVVIEAKLKLKQERRSLIESWLTENVGVFEREATILSNQSEDVPDKIVVQNNGQASTAISEEINVAESYEEIAARVQSWEKKSDLDGIRAELALQDKMRARRKRQRHQRAQQLLQVKTDDKPEV
ncbi:hypothetical protein ACHWQZ_G012809 [Mnemiopsis leidyi]